MSRWIRASSLLMRYQTSHKSRYFRAGLAVRATALSASISFGLSTAKITSWTCTNPGVTRTIRGPLSYDGTLANSILILDFGERGAALIGTTICQAATATLSPLMIDGSCGCLSVTCDGSTSN